MNEEDVHNKKAKYGKKKSASCSQEKDGTSAAQLTKVPRSSAVLVSSITLCILTCTLWHTGDWWGCCARNSHLSRMWIHREVMPSIKCLAYFHFLGPTPKSKMACYTTVQYPNWDVPVAITCSVRLAAVWHIITICVKDSNFEHTLSAIKKKTKPFVGEIVSFHSVFPLFFIFFWGLFLFIPPTFFTRHWVEVIIYLAVSFIETAIVIVLFFFSFWLFRTLQRSGKAIVLVLIFFFFFFFFLFFHFFSLFRQIFPPPNFGSLLYLIIFKLGTYLEARPRTVLNEIWNDDVIRCRVTSL